MKTKLKFTRGELAAAILMLVVVLSSNVVYFFCESRPKKSYDFSEYADLFDKFNKQQQLIEDSINSLRLKYRETKIRSDTLPKFKKQERKQLYQIVRLDLNSCDTNDLLTVPQFGSKRASKLVEYREKLGGFHSFSQLSEVYVLQNIDTIKLKEYLYIDKSSIKTINVNTATYKDLCSHPYFDAYLSKLIIRHRETKGNIRNLSELQEITHAYPELIDRLRHYVCF